MGVLAPIGYVNAPRSTGSWSKGRSDYYAYYPGRPGCRDVNVTKTKLETAFTEELARLQPSAVYMRALKEEILQLWKARKDAIAAELAEAERRAQAQSRRSSAGWTRRSCWLV